MVRDDTDKTLAGREKQYGDFSKVATTAQQIKSALRLGTDGYSDVETEALSMIAVKLARIVHGNRDLLDNWHDIAGYAILVERHLDDCAKLLAEHEDSESIRPSPRDTPFTLDT